jgi:hypothetical protein
VLTCHYRCYLRQYEYICHPICLVSNKRRKTLSGSSKLESERKLCKWEEVSFETSGPWSTKSSRGNRYYAAFVDHKDGLKITIPRPKRKHVPIVFLNFVIRIGCWPKILYSDVAGEFISRVFKTIQSLCGANAMEYSKRHGDETPVDPCGNDT